MPNPILRPIAFIPDAPEIYTNRIWRAVNGLKRGHGGEDAAGCLDAPEQMPGGAVRCYGKSCPRVLQVLVTRGDVDRTPDPAVVQALLVQLARQV